MTTKRYFEMDRELFSQCEKAFRDTYRQIKGNYGPRDTGDWFAYYDVRTIEDAIKCARIAADLRGNCDEFGNNPD